MDNLGVNIAATTIGTIDRVVLSAVAGMRDVGLYSAQYELSTKPSSLLRVANSVLFPAAAAMHADGRSLSVPWLRVTLAGSQTLVAVAAVAIGLRQPIVAWLLGPDYAPYSDVFGFLMIALALQFFGYACPVLLNARGDFALQRRLYLVAAGAMAACAVPVTIAHGIVGLAALYLAVRAVDLVMFFMTLRSTGIRPRAGPLWVHFAIAAAALVLAWSGSLAWTLVGAAVSAVTAAMLLRLPPDRLVCA
jgi:O-antigen/teichoic acid export membrane protein